VKKEKKMMESIKRSFPMKRI